MLRAPLSKDEVTFARHPLDDIRREKRAAADVADRKYGRFHPVAKHLQRGTLIRNVIGAEIDQRESFFLIHQDDRAYTLGVGATHARCLGRSLKRPEFAHGSASALRREERTQKEAEQKWHRRTANDRQGMGKKFSITVLKFTLTDGSRSVLSPAQLGEVAEWSKAALC